MHSDCYTTEAPISEGSSIPGTYSIKGFAALKVRLTSATSLTHQTERDEFTLDTAASDKAMGVLSRVQDGAENVIAYGKTVSLGRNFWL